MPLRDETKIHFSVRRREFGWICPAQEGLCRKLKVQDAKQHHFLSNRSLQQVGGKGGCGGVRAAVKSSSNPHFQSQQVPATQPQQHISTAITHHRGRLNRKTASLKAKLAVSNQEMNPNRSSLLDCTPKLLKSSDPLTAFTNSES